MALLGVQFSKCARVGLDNADIVRDALFSALYSHTQQTAPNQTGPFQLVPAEYSVSSKGSSWEQHSLFLVDSQTGRVWEYLPARESKDGTFHDAGLIPVARATP